jgi:hypothetical protein
MRHIAIATITLPVVASFEDDGIHTLADQAAEALKVEAISEFCLLWDNEHQLENMQISPVGE